MEENFRLGETSKSGFTYRDKGGKIKKIIITTLFGCPLWMFTKKSATQKKYPQLDHSKAKREEETGMNIVNTIESVGTPPTNGLT
ncbi:uncharacterized protein DS421_20g690400 [Arachis hypogaea]|nr:uncharacterized protein DS421_20g690400 [Arachis hypogaea]